MSALSDHQLMDRIISRLEADPVQDAQATTRQLTIVTTHLIDTVRQLNVAFSEAPPSSNEGAVTGWRFLKRK